MENGVQLKSMEDLIKISPRKKALTEKKKSKKAKRKPNRRRSFRGIRKSLVHSGT